MEALDGTQSLYNLERLLRRHYDLRFRFGHEEACADTDIAIEAVKKVMKEVDIAVAFTAAMESPAYQALQAKPRPGSATAELQGCTCPVIDNHYGKGRPCSGKTEWIVSGNCPLHGGTL